MTEAPPDRLGSFDELRGHAAEAIRSVDEQAAHFRRRIEAGLFEPLHDLLAEAGAAHDSALATFENVALNPHDVWHAILLYRRESRDGALLPVIRHLRENRLPQTVGEAYTEFLSQGEKVTDSVPETVYVGENEELLSPRDGDSLGVRFRRLVRRARRRLFPDRNPAIAVPIASVIGYHVGARLPLLHTPVFEEVLREVARAESRIEHAFSVWTQSLLVAEREIDSPAVHAQDDVPWPTAIPDAEPDGDGSPDDTAATDHAAAAVEHVVSAGQRLRDTFRNLLARKLSVPEVDPDLVEIADKRLERDLADFSVAVRRPPAAPDFGSGYGPAERARDVAVRWRGWHDQVIDRLELGDQMLELRRRILETEDNLLGAVARKSLVPFFETTKAMEDKLQEFSADAEGACTSAEQGCSVEDLRKSLRHIRLRSGRYFEATIRALPGLVAADEALGEPGRGIWESLLRSLDRLPESLTIHALPSEDASAVNASASTQTIELRDFIKRSLGPMSRRLQPGAAPLRTQLRSSWSRIEEVQNVVLFNLDAALAEVSAIASGEGDDADDAEGADDSRDDSIRAAARARELANVGLTRAREILVEMRRSLRGPWESFERTAVEEIQSQWITVLRRLRTGDEADQHWENTWQGLRRQAIAARRYLESRRASMWETIRTNALRLFGRIRRLVRLGQTAVGGVQSTDSDLVQAIDEISELTELRKRLPLVYRHLFTFEPLTEATLHEGRDADLEWLGEQFAHWRKTRRGGAIVVVAPQGAGRTSFLRIVASGGLGSMNGTTIASVSLEKRIEQESDFVGTLAEALALPGNGATTLEELEGKILSSQNSGDLVCLIDDLEHLLIRTPYGTELIERVLVFLSRTDTSVFWVTSTNELAWRYIGASVSGTASGFLTSRVLTPFSAATLRDVVLSRHKRSGMQLRFEAPAVQSARVRHLVRPRNEVERQQALQDDFFGRLFRLSGQNIMLALFYWIRACAFDTDAGIVTVSSPQPLALDPIGRLPLASAFALENFLFHKTMSADEHARISRMEADESVLLLESLLNGRIIEPVGSETDESRSRHAARIEPDSRYRIHPLLLNASLNALQQRHIVY